jgi:2-dehydro-3-deoxyphosphogluconate aldolase/(4S)-4-hydroxy-2-oxoglutarate aldolase
VSQSLRAALSVSPILPLLQADEPATAVRVARALQAAGLPAVEVVQRTAGSRACLEAVARELPRLLVGAGTVLSGRQADDCVSAGARFIVSPGLDETVVDAARRHAIDVFPGIVTPTELMRAIALDLDVVKFFPAIASGGAAAIDAIASAFPAVRFIPTGGIGAANLAAFLELRSVLACGGSWMTPPDAIIAGDFTRITALATDALATARRLRGSQPT